MFLFAYFLSLKKYCFQDKCNKIAEPASLIINVIALQVLKAGGFPNDTMSVIAGLSNDYADYCTTYEEYQVICIKNCW